MDFFSQAWVGAQKELSVYKHNPRLLCHKVASIIIFVGLTIIFGIANNSQLAVAAVLNAIWQIQLFFSLSRALIQKISQEREQNFKEYFMINGMSKAAYQAKIAVSSYIEMFFCALPQSISLYLIYKQYFESFATKFQKAFFQFFAILFFGGISVINLSLLLATLLNPRAAHSVGSMIILLLGFLYYAATLNSSLPAYIIISCIPTAGLALATNAVLPADQTQIIWDGYSPLLGMLVLAVSGAIFLALYLYRERDKDKDLNKSKQAKVKNKDIPLQRLEGHLKLVEDLEQANDSSSSIRDYTSAIHYEKNQDSVYFSKTIEAVNIKKVFCDFTAVDNITFSIYEREIFCLLGHNGAGKTTLVSILTGLISKTEGTFYYHGEEVLSNLNQIRGAIGFCPQKDFLLLENTVYENLRLFAEIKKVPEDRVEAEIDRIVKKMGLGLFKDMPAKNLSGGFKRKLNMGIALIKDPKIIIMDEPTSGMDPVSRREFWSILKGLKEERKTVILTTQFLDEAEELADRVAIMAKGKLFALGSIEFIRKKFGAGYNLTLSSQSEEINSQTLEIASLVQANVSSATRQFDVPPDTLKFTLPFTEQGKFAALFSELENIKDLQMNLQIVSLEETFVSLGVDPDQMLEKETEGNREEIREQHPTIPNAYFQRKIPTFADQLQSILLEKLYKVQRNKGYLFFLTFPLMFLVGGVVIGGNQTDKIAGIQMISSMLFSGNSTLAATFGVPLAAERVHKISLTLKAMGLRSLPYWLGNLIADLIIKLVMCLIIVAAIYICDIDLLKDSVLSFIVLYMAYSFRMLIQVYNLSFFSNNVEALMGIMPAVLNAGYLLPTLMNRLFSLVFGFEPLTLFYILSFIFLGPSCLLYLGLFSLVPEEFTDQNFKDFAPFKSSWIYALLALLFGIFEFYKLLLKDSKAFELKEKIVYQETQNLEDDTPIETDDILREKDRLFSSQNHDLIKALNVKKVYANGFKALEDLSFGVEKGQIFCLLGPNGAGKTTAFGIMTTMIPKTEGLVQMDGLNISRDAAEIFYQTGICSQLNTIWDYITVEQHLRIYACLKGMKRLEVDQIIQYLLKALQLEEYAQRAADKLSEGNKRKLCVAICLIGAPKFVFLDEPSTGMDPIARRHLWSLIKDIMKRKEGAMILTTHHMQEAELVGDKLGILVNGRFTTIGTMSDLKRKFGEYSIVVYETENGLTSSEIDNLVRSILPSAKKQTQNEERGIIFKVPDDSMKFSKIFLQLENKKAQRKIKDFSIYTTTLEQIFIKLAKSQKEQDVH